MATFMWDFKQICYHILASRMVGPRQLKHDAVETEAPSIILWKLGILWVQVNVAPSTSQLHACHENPV